MRYLAVLPFISGILAMLVPSGSRIGASCTSDPFVYLLVDFGVVLSIFLPWQLVSMFRRQAAGEKLFAAMCSFFIAGLLIYKYGGV